MIFKNGSNPKEFCMKRVFPKHLNKMVLRNDKIRSLSSQLEAWSQLLISHVSCGQKHQIMLYIWKKNRLIGKALPGMMPYEAWFGRKPNLSHLRMFGCSAYMHIPADERYKLCPKTRKCVFVGYCETQKGFRQRDSLLRRIFCVQRRSLILRRHWSRNNWTVNR